MIIHYNGTDITKQTASIIKEIYSTLIKFIYQVFHRILSNLEFIYESHVQDRSYGLLSYITMFVLVDVNLYLRDVPAD